MCKWSQLKGIYPHGNLNAIPKWMFGVEACEIHTALPEFNLEGYLLNETYLTDLIPLNVVVQKKLGVSFNQRRTEAGTEENCG